MEGKTLYKPLAPVIQHTHPSAESSPTSLYTPVVFTFISTSSVILPCLSSTDATSLVADNGFLMPKKYRNTQFSKPPSTVHRPLSNAAAAAASSVNATSSLRTPTNYDSSQNTNNTNSSTVRSVNELIHQARHAQSLSPAQRVAAASALNPQESSRLIIGPLSTSPVPIESTTTPVSTDRHYNVQTPRIHFGLTPQERMAERRRARGPAGPPPPRSWLSDSMHAPRGRKIRSEEKQYLTKNLEVGHRHSPYRLPGLTLLGTDTLQHLTMKRLAQNWELHVEHEPEMLDLLPDKLKEVLVAYIARYAMNGITKAALEVIFMQVFEDSSATSSTNTAHLDLSGMVGKSISIDALKQLCTKPVAIASTSSIDVPESWDADPFLATASAALDSITMSERPYFANLTHLSLAHSPSPSWPKLLSLANHLSTLTHLSLAGWPTPSLTPKSKTATIMTSVPGRGSIPTRLRYGASDFYSEFDDDWTELYGVMRRLGKSLLCLKWMDLEGCSWIRGLGVEIDPLLSTEDVEDGDEESTLLSAESRSTMHGTTSRQALNLGKRSLWDRAWSGIETVIVSQGWVPKSLEFENGPWKRILGLVPRRPVNAPGQPLPNQPETNNNNNNTTNIDAQNSTQLYQPPMNATRRPMGMQALPPIGSWNQSVEEQEFKLRAELKAWLKVEREAIKVQTRANQIRRQRGLFDVVSFERGKHEGWVEALIWDARIRVD